MKGKIKFVDKRTQQWGYIIPDDNSKDIRFNVADLVAVAPGSRLAGVEVEFEVEDQSGGRCARVVRVCGISSDQIVPVVSERSPRPPSNSLGDALTRWAFVPFVPFKDRSGKDWQSVVHLLADKALPEKWHFGEQPDSRKPFPILENYLRYTFFKVQKEGKIAEASDDRGSLKRWAAFNTGLVDNMYDSIYALFESNSRSNAQPWCFVDFCVPGKGTSGKKLTAIFDPLPEPPRYFTSNFDMLLDTSREIHVDYPHVIVDGIRRDRFPSAFLEDYTPKGWTWQDYSRLPYAERAQYLTAFSEAVDSDVQCMREIRRRLEDAKDLAEKRTRWNFKTAIPQYYPRLDKMSLLLPLAIRDDSEVDMALVVSRNPSGSYQGWTVLPLDWAYKNARLVCRPDSDWLIPQQVKDLSDVIDEES